MKERAYRIFYKTSNPGYINKFSLPSWQCLSFNYLSNASAPRKIKETNPGSWALRCSSQLNENLYCEKYLNLSKEDQFDGVRYRVFCWAEGWTRSLPRALSPLLFCILSHPHEWELLLLLIISDDKQKIHSVLWESWPDESMVTFCKKNILITFIHHPSHFLSDSGQFTGKFCTS